MEYVEKDTRSISSSQVGVILVTGLSCDVLYCAINLHVDCDSILKEFICTHICTTLISYIDPELAEGGSLYNLIHEQHYHPDLEESIRWAEEIAEGKYMYM